MEERGGEGGSVRVKGDRYRYPFIAEFFLIFNRILYDRSDYVSWINFFFICIVKFYFDIFFDRNVIFRNDVINDEWQGRNRRSDVYFSRYVRGKEVYVLGLNESREGESRRKDLWNGLFSPSDPPPLNAASLATGKKKKRGCHPSCRPRSKKLSNNPNASLPCPFLFLFPRYIIRLKINIGNRSFPKIINHARRCAPWTHRELSAWKPPLSACEGEESTARKSRLKFHSSIKLYRGHR